MVGPTLSLSSRGQRRRARLGALVSVGLLVSCGPDASPAEAPAPPDPPATIAEDPAPAEPTISVAQATRLLFPEGLADPGRCLSGTVDPVRCLIWLRYQGHEDETLDALALYDGFGDVAGVEQEQDFDGSFRGLIRLVPALPVGRHRHHLAWVLAAQRQIAGFLSALDQIATRPVQFRHRAIGWRFLRSVKRATPSAYAVDWEIGYNVSGTLLQSADGVFETLFHELFHVNDSARGGWSDRVLAELVHEIDARCDNQTGCLAPYAPTQLKVRDGTWYAFQHNNGEIAREYAAELAHRYLIEQRAALAGQAPPQGWFACVAPENQQAMTALADEFFGGVQLGPICP